MPRLNSHSRDSGSRYFSITDTTTAYPSATTTQTVITTSTSIDTSTTTSTSTSTSTSFTAISTLYAQCATDNLADTVSGQVIGTTYDTSNGLYVDTVVSSTSAYDCELKPEHAPADRAPQRRKDWRRRFRSLGYLPERVLSRQMPSRAFS